MNNLAGLICDRLGSFAILRPELEIGGLSGTEFLDLVQRWARAISDEGVRPGEAVAIVAGNSPAYLIAYLGIMYCGAVAVPVNYKLGTETIAFILSETNAQLVFCDDERRPMLPTTILAIDLPLENVGKWTFPARSGLAKSASLDDNDALCAILYTSGSTGKPKGVPLQHAGQIWALQKSLTPVAVEGDEKTSVVAPFYHMNGLFFASVALANGWTLDLPSRFDAAAYVEAIGSRGYSLLSGVPSMFALMLQKLENAGDVQFPKVRTVRIGSAPLAPALIDRVKAIMPNASFYNSYGTTEAGPAVFGPHPAGKPAPALSVGHPWPDVCWRLHDENDAETEREGVLSVRTPALTSGYLQRAELNKDRFQDGWYNTGDIMRRDANGFFFFVGRFDDMFVCAGENLYPGEIELRLEQHPEVIQAIVVPAADDIKGYVPVAFVQLVSGAAATEVDLKQLALDTGPAYAHPRVVIVKDALPVGTTHKIDRRALVAEAEGVMRLLGRLT
jgi:long-chain acyl-CoA synthetase